MNVIEDPFFIKHILNHRDKLLQKVEVELEVQKRGSYNLEVFE